MSVLFSMRPLLADPSLKPTKEHILAARSNLHALLAIRYSSPLFRLGSAETIQVSHPAFRSDVEFMELKTSGRGVKSGVFRTQTH